jgi:hypothetical protein
MVDLLMGALHAMGEPVNDVLSIVAKDTAHVI